MDTYIIDIDKTLCIAEKINDKCDYVNAKPITKMIDKVNELKKIGHTIILFTARGMRTYNENKKEIEQNIKPVLENWLLRNNVLYDRLIVGKIWGPGNLYYVDDKNLTLTQFLNNDSDQHKEILKENTRGILHD